MELNLSSKLSSRKSSDWMSDLFTEEVRESVVFLFIPGLYSGKFPGGKDAPDVFKSWIEEVDMIDICVVIVCENL